MERHSDARQHGKLLWYDPNPKDNVPIPLEDLTISVDLEVTYKPRSILVKDVQKKYTMSVGNMGQAKFENRVNFFSGSDLDGNKRRELTTHYTDIQGLNSTPEDDYEALNIESINIEFNSSYAPMVKIKFIDIRGAAMFSNGADSKYGFFFELPYPIFNLTIKGFYGKAVSYCLHLLRFNASFNSQTGNFEIDCDFIGFTYAMLTDMLMGLVRASTSTTRGAAIYQKIKSEYGNQDSIVTIDELIDKIAEVDEKIEKIKSEEDAQNLEDEEKVKTEIEALRTLVLTHLETYSDGQTMYNPDVKSGYVIMTTPTTSRWTIINNSSDTYRTNVKNKINNEIKKLVDWNTTDVNYKIIVDELDGPPSNGDCPNFSRWMEMSNMTSDDLKDEATLRSKLKSNGYSGDKLERLVAYVEDTVKSSGNLPNNTQLVVVDLSSAIKACDNSIDAVETKNEATIQSVTDKLKAEIKSTLGFDPTIRNLIRVLCISTETFLQCIYEVSRDAENNATRANEFNKLDVRGFDKKRNSVDEIFPWPEYKKKDFKSDGYEETWLGVEKKIVVENVPELKFTEELLQEMLKQAKKDNLRAEASNGIDNWYPISVLDTPVPVTTYYNNSRETKVLMEKNPYKIGLYDELPNVPGPLSTADEALRVMMYRAFLLLGVSNYNNIGDEFIRLHAKLEAENLYDAIKSAPDNGTSIKSTITGYDAEGVYNLFKAGTALNVQGLKKPFFEENGDYCKYIYIRKDVSGRAYIPINGNFNGEGFYVTGTDNIKDHKVIINDLIDGLYVSNANNNTRTDTTPGSNVVSPKTEEGDANREYRGSFALEDNATILNIISKDEYEGSSISPGFGTAVATSYSSGGDLPRDEVSEAMRNKGVTKLYFNPIKSGRYLANEYSAINYGTASNFIGYGGTDSNQWTSDMLTANSDNLGTATSMIAFFTHYSGTLPNIETFNGFANGFDGSKYKYGWFEDNSNLKINGYYKLNKLDFYSFNKEAYANYGFNRVALQKALDSGIEIYTPKIEYSVDSKYSQSLFGTKFYYYQRSANPASKISNAPTVGNASKALLFLHCFPFQGVIRPDVSGFYVSDYFMFDYNNSDGDDWMESYKKNINNEPQVLGIKGLFRAHNGFVKAPKIWALFMGAILWRRDYWLNQGDEYYSAGGVSVDPIIWTQDNGKYIIPNMTSAREPRTDEFLYVVNFKNDYNRYAIAGMNFNFSSANYTNPYSENTGQASYSRIDEAIIGLPKQVKHKFINYFLEWVSDEFTQIQQELEIDISSIINYNAKWENYLKGCVPDANPTANPNVIYTTKANVVNNLGQNIFDNYVSVVPMEEVASTVQYAHIRNDKYTYSMELNPNGNGMELIRNLLLEPVYIQNGAPQVWVPPNLNKTTKSANPYQYGITTTKTNIKTFIKEFLEHFRVISGDYEQTVKEEEDALKKALFNSLDDDKIKLNIYRTLMSIYQKWIGGTNESFFSQCAYSPSDSKIAAYERKGNTRPRLIDTFRFLDRSFNDIGDLFYMNPQIFYNLLTKNANASFFDIVNKVLSDNNFNFIPLPSFVNFNDPKQLADIFEPYPYNDSVVSGPSFVCVYAGQTSNNLDLGPNANYEDDGIFITFDKSGNPIGMPEDLNNPNPLTVYETNLPVFTVNYGQQNQNYFKDVKLDQKEFAETAESLEIIDDISQGGDKAKYVSVGQNLFNVYQKRSYSCEVEMLGCALIQPMMYFQLNNIPMFRGLYLIINVSHSIRPNSMTTTFKGVRVKKTKTPLLTASDVLMTLIGDVSNPENGGSGSGSGGTKLGSVPIIATNADRNKVVKVVVDRLKYHGWCDNCIASFAGDLGRENGWNRSTIFNGHSDPKNGRANLGIISWQNERRTKLIEYMDSKGHMPSGQNGPMNYDDKALESMVDFLLYYDPGGIKYYSATYKYPTPPNSSRQNVLYNHAGKKWTAADFKDNRNSTLKCSQALWSIIVYCFKCGKVYNTEDALFFSVNNHKYAKKAKELGYVNYNGD